MDQPKVNQNLFTVLERGDVKIDKAKKKAIVLIGITRAGKSTTFNWILKKCLIGKGKLKNTFYEVVQDDSETAKLGFGYTSVTLDPNICSKYTLKNSKGEEEQVSLIDMAGFQDSRDYVGVIGVSYFLKAIFQQVREAKFVIVFDETRLTQGTGKGIIQTFNGLINMFHIDLMTPAVKKQFLQSLCVVVTKSREGHNHRQYLENTVQQLQNQELNVANKNLIIEIITHIINEGKMEDFAAAANDKLAQSCSFVQRFSNERDWNYFNLDEAKKLLSSSLQNLPKNKEFQKLDEQQKQHFRKAITNEIKEIINIPFQKDFKALNLQQTKKFIVSIQEKVKSYQDFSTILSTLIKVFNQNWQKMLEKQNTTGVVEPNYFKVNEMFQKVKQFLSKNDVYSSSTKIQFSLERSFQKIGLVQAIRQILLIYEQVEMISSKDNNDSFQEAMKRFSTEFSSLVDCLKAFALKVEEENMLDRLKYVLSRGFRQFSKLYELKPDSIHDIKVKLTDNLNQTFFEAKKEFLERFILPMNENLLSKLFTTIPQLQQYEQLFSKYEFENQQNQDKLFFSKHWYTLEMAKADLHFHNSQKCKALLCFIRALRRLCESSTMQNYEIEDELKKKWMKKLRLLKKIIKILSCLPQNVNFSPKICALQLCEYHNMLDETAEVYDLIIDSSSLSRQEKSNYYEYYANFCAKWGEVEKAIRLLKKKLSLEDEDYERYMYTVDLIKQMIQGKANYIKQTNQLFASWKKIPKTDNVLLEKLEDIQNWVSKL